MSTEPTPIYVTSLPDIVASRHPVGGFDTIVLDGRRLLVWRTSATSPIGVRVVSLTDEGLTLLLTYSYDTIDLLDIVDFLEGSGDE